MTEVKGRGSYYDNTRLADYTGGEVATGRGHVDMPFLLITLLLLAIGVIMVLSASFARAYYDPANETGGIATYYFTRQLIFSVIGVVSMYAASLFPLSFYRRFSKPVMLVTIVLLAAVLIIGIVGGGSRRWIDLGFTTLQPSEIAKLAVILLFGDMICRRKDKMATLRNMTPFIAVLGIIVGLLLLEPHISGSVIIIAVGAVMLFLGGAKLKWFIVGLGGVAAAGTVVVTMFAHASTRISVWLDPLADTTGDGWQIIQSLYAVGSGGLMGLGLGQSRQKYLYLPEEHNDFIFSIVCEELGFIGAGIILMLFALLIVRGFWLAMHAKNRFDFLVVGGLTALLALQVVLNVAVVTNLVPCTGISLPFFSYGGTALIMQLGEMGLILSASRDIPGKKAG